MIDVKDRIRGENVRRLFALSLRSASDSIYDKAAKFYLNDPRAILYGYEKGTTVLGLIGLRVEGKGKAVVQHIAVDKRYQRNGIGREMMEFVMQKLHLKIIQALSPEETRSFFEKLGFSATQSDDRTFNCLLSKY